MIGAALVLVGVLAGPAPCPVAGGDDEAARAAYRTGERLYAAGHYEQAVVAFASALELSGRAELLFDLANTYERMGERARAAELLDRYVACAAPPDAELVRERARRLRSRPLRPVGEQAICPADEERPPAILATPEPVQRAARRAGSPVGRAETRAAPWLIGGSLALAAGATMLLGGAALGGDGGSDGADACTRRPCAAGHPGLAASLERAGAVSVAAGAVSIAAGLLLVVRPAPRARRWRIDAGPAEASVSLSVTRDF